jgi:hypothetical protein
MRNYGVTLNIHPGRTVKRVVIHKLPCPYYGQKRQSRSGVYAFRKYCETFDEAVQRASEWSLEWHAPIKICSRCRGNWNLP